MLISMPLITVADENNNTEKETTSAENTETTTPSNENKEKPKTTTDNTTNENETVVPTDNKDKKENEESNSTENINNEKKEETTSNSLVIPPVVSQTLKENGIEVTDQQIQDFLKANPEVLEAKLNEIPIDLAIETFKKMDHSSIIPNSGIGVFLSGNSGEPGGGIYLESNQTVTGKGDASNNLCSHTILSAAKDHSDKLKALCDTIASTYGHSNFSLRLGVPFGVKYSGSSGYQITPENSPFHFGVEPTNVDFNLTTVRKKEDGTNDLDNFLEWTPAGSLGYLYSKGNCRVLSLLRGGYSLSSRGSGAMVGAGIYTNCNDFNSTGEITFVYPNSGGSRVTTTLDGSVPLDFNRNIKVGIRTNIISDNTDKHPETDDLYNKSTVEILGGVRFEY